MASSCCSYEIVYLVLLLFYYKTLINVNIQGCFSLVNFADKFLSFTYFEYTLIQQSIAIGTVCEDLNFTYVCVDSIPSEICYFTTGRPHAYCKIIEIRLKHLHFQAVQLAPCLQFLRQAD